MRNVVGPIGLIDKDLKMKAITALDLQKMKAGNKKIVMVTAYDYTMARLVDSAGVDMVLVGDSLGMVIQGHDDTLSVTMDDMVYHGKCVSRALKRAHLTVDMPFMSYQVSVSQALENAGRLVKSAGAQSVKLEGGARTVPMISAIVQAGIPVVGHLGLTPQSLHAIGGFRVQGRTEPDRNELIDDALRIQDAGAFALVLEMIPADLAAAISEQLSIPTIGIGAGIACDGQVLVCNDLLGMDQSFTPRFLKRYASFESEAIRAIGTYAEDVREGRFPGPENSFGQKTRSPKVARLY